jgi:hypothetical protein
MSKLDRIKAGISFHEKMFFTAIAMMLGLLDGLQIFIVQQMPQCFF